MLPDALEHIRVALILDSCLRRSGSKLLHILAFVLMKVSMVSDRLQRVASGFERPNFFANVWTINFL